jgi:subtilisin family serine protease
MASNEDTTPHRAVGTGDAMRSLSLASLVLLAACGPTLMPQDVDQRVLEPVGTNEDTSSNDVSDAPVLGEADTRIQDAPSLIPGAWVLRVRDGATLDDPALAQRLQELGADGVTAMAGAGTYRFHSEAAAEAIEGLGDDDDVLWVEPVVRMMPLTNDAYFADQWHLPQLNVPNAWAWNRGAGAVVAVVDTGVLRIDELGLANADGIENLLPAKEYVPVEPILLDANTQVEVPDDDVGHGTHIASTIAQRTDNGVGGAGIAPDATILPIRALGQYGGTSTDVADAIRYAADQGAHVVNLSLGSALYSEAIAEACQYAADQGVVLIAASGNDGHSRFVSYPAALDTTLAVGAVGPDWVVTDYSNRGPELDVVAPGGVWYDYDRNGLYDGIAAETWNAWVGVEGVEDGVYVGGYFLSGTSMATATVSGVAALLVAEGATREQVIDLLTSTAVDLGNPGWDTENGFGMVDAAAALEAFAGPAPEPEPEAPRTADELVAGDLVFTELMANPDWCASDSCEWFEVENTSATAIDLAGLQVRDAGGSTGTLDTSVVLEPGELAVLGRGSAAGWDQPDIAPDAFYGTSVTLNNGGDTVFLFNASGDVAQSVTWSSSEAGISLSLVGTDPLDLASWVASDTVAATALPTTGEWATPHTR